MNQSSLHLPQRQVKPRTTGLTLCIDNGMPTSTFKDYIESHGDLVDFVKFGWGTSLVTEQIVEKIEILNRKNVKFYFGGTLFEKFYSQNKFKDFVSYCQKHGAQYVEVSDGVIELSVESRDALIRDLSEEFNVFSEVGYKDQDRSINLPPKAWVEKIEADIKSGSQHVITEARESGTSGICRSDGELRFGLIEEILESGIDISKIIFEAPNKTLQTYFVKRVGSNVNVGNIAFKDIVGLETLRLGLRADTFFAFEEKNA